MISGSHLYGKIHPAYQDDFKCQTIDGVDIPLKIHLVIIINDRETGKSKGFGFVTFHEIPDANDAIEDLDQKDLDGRQIKVNKAKAKERRNESGGYRDRRGGSRNNYSGSSYSQDNRRGHRNDYSDNYR